MKWTSLLCMAWPRLAVAAAGLVQLPVCHPRPWPGVAAGAALHLRRRLCPARPRSAVLLPIVLTVWIM